METQKVSILIPVYGVEKYIAKCLESVVNQTYNNIEIIFVNDCTKDNSIKIIENYINSKGINYDKIKIINNPINLGLAATRNNGLKYATGDFIFHLDSDDYLELNAIEILINLQEADDSDIVFSNIRYVYSNSFSEVYQLNTANCVNDYLENILYRNTGLSVVGNLYKKELFDNVKFIEGLNFGEDYVTLPKLVFYSKKISFLKKSIYNYLKINLNSYTSNINEKSILDILAAYKSISTFFLRNNSSFFLEINKTAFYNLKSQIIKTTKGDNELLYFFKMQIKDYSKQYPSTNSKVNNLINLVFDFSSPLCSVIIKKLSK